MSLIRVNVEKCERDGICVEVCPIGILEMTDGTGPQVRAGAGHFCIGCGHCVAACPTGALDNAKNSLEKHLPVTQPGATLTSRAAYAFLRGRRSIRCYSPEPVASEAMLQLLDIARFAPTGHNSQGLSFLVVQGSEPLLRMRKIVVEWMRKLIETQPALADRLHMPGIVKAHERGEDRILRGAPQVIVCHVPAELRATAQVSTYLALEFIELYATALGLGTCWAGFAQFCAQQYPALPEYLQIPRDRDITGMMMVGHPKYTYYRMPDRDPLDVAWFDPA